MTTAIEALEGDHVVPTGSPAWRGKTRWRPMFAEQPSDRTARLDLFGGPILSVPGGPCELTGHQQALLTVVFAQGGRGINRPRLGWLMWGEDETPKIRQRIRQLLYRTQSRVGRSLFVTEGDTVKPVTSGFVCDLVRFEGLLRRGPIADAAGILARGFASRLQDHPTDGFEEWLVAKSVALLEDLRRNAARRWDETSEAGLWGEARDAAEALYMHFPADLGVVSRVIESRARTGSLASAEAVLGHFRDSNQSGDVPKELLALMGRIRRLREVPVARSPVPELRAPMVGRADEMAKARALFEKVHRGQFQFALIAGEAGIGKTRVLEELKREAILEGFRCLHARPAEPEQRIPLNPLADALEEVDLAGHLRALGAPWRSVIASLLPVADDEPMEAVPPIQEGRLSRRLMDALFMLMERVASEEPTILFIDDLQWADATTVSALQFIQRRWDSGPLGIIAAARPDLMAHTEPGKRYLENHEDLAVSIIELGELTHRDAQRLVEHLLGPRMEEHVADRLCELAGRHPLYLTELARDFAAGRLDLPRLPADNIPIPVSLQELFRSRVRRLSSMATKVAGLLAVRARPMRLTDVAELTGIPLEHCADCVEELALLRLVDVQTDRLGVAHELFRSALYQNLSKARRAVLHRAIAEHLSSGSDEAAAGELAIHYSRGGERDAAAMHGWSAAKSAVDNGAIAEAAFFFELVVDNDKDPTRRADATAELARALHLGRAIGRANPVLELAAARLRLTGNLVGALRMDVRHVDGLAETGSAPVEELLGRLLSIKKESRALGDWEGLALALDTELELRHSAGDLRGIRDLFVEMGEVIREGTRPAAAIAHSGIALGVLFGDHHEALESARHAVAFCDPAGDHRLHVLLRCLLVLQYQGLFYSDEASRIVAEAQDLAKRSGDLRLRFSIESNLAVAHLDAGDLDRAEVLMLSSSQMLGSAELDLNRFNQAYNAGELAFAQGHYDQALRHFDIASGYIGRRTPVYAADLVNAGVGLCALETGDLQEAREREDALASMPSRWYVDPTSLVAFASRMHEMRREYPAAREILDQAANGVQDRLVLAWLKIRLLQIPLERKLDPRRGEILAREGLARSRELGLTHRTAQFERHLIRLGGPHTQP